MAGFRMNVSTPNLGVVTDIIKSDVAAVEEAAKDDKERYKIDLSKTYSEPSYLIKSGGVGTIPRGDIIAVKAKSKHGKTFLCSIFAAVAMGAEWGSLNAVENDCKVMFVDTEQHEKNVARVARRIHAMAGIDIHKNSGRLLCYALRKMEMNKRWQFISDRITEERPDLVIIDGIADLIADFNNITESQEIIGKLMATSAEFNLSIIFVLHTNKSKEDNNMKGHLGTMAVQKCSDVFEVVKNVATFNVSVSECRNIPIPEFSFILDNDGVPHPSTVEKSAARGQSKVEAELRRLLPKVFDFQTRLRYCQLKTAYIQAAGGIDLCSDGTAKNRIKSAMEMGLIVQNEEGEFSLK